MKMKTKNKELQLIWDDLIDALGDMRKIDVKKLEKNGFHYTYNGKHPKLTFTYANRDWVVVLSSSPSDYQAHRQILRVIRRIYENN